MWKKYFWNIFIVVLFLATLASLPSVDYVAPNVFFYFQHLPPIYHICILILIFTALLSKQRLTQILSVCLVSLLILWSPFVMLVQPWHLDSYPFVSQAVYVARNGHISHDLKYLSESPVLGLTFGSYFLVTGINPIVSLKIYPALLAVILAISFYTITNKLGIGIKASTVASLLFVSMFWVNIIHFCRQSFALVFYLMSLLLFFHLLLHGMDRRIFALLCSQVLVLVMSHPATALFFISNLVAIAILGWAIRRISSKDLRTISSTITISAIFWLLWNMIGTEPGVIYTLKQISGRVFSSLQENPSEFSGTAKIFVGYTPTYNLINNTRFLLTLYLFASAFFVSLFAIVLRKHSFKERKLSLILTGLAWSNMAFAVPLLYAGLPYFSKPVLFSLISWVPLGALVYRTLAGGGKKGKISKTRRISLWMFLLSFIVLPSLILPIIKYAPLPYLYPTTTELESKVFLDSHLGGENLLMLEFYFPLRYSYTLYGSNDAYPNMKFEATYHWGEGLDLSVIHDSSVWITYRLCTRDAFYNYKPSMFQVIKNVTETLPESTHNKVYDAGWPTWILTPIPIEATP